MYTGPQDTRVLTGVMDQDSAAWAVKPENYRYALNLINIFNQQKGSHTSIQGTIEVINTSLKNGTNKCIGYFEDIKGGSVIFFVYNELGYHAIFRWFENRPGYTNGVIETIYQVQTPSFYDEYEPNPLSFDPDYLVTGVNLVDDLLYWTDYHTGPKMINIKRANESGKKREFNLYFNDNTFERFTPSLIHTLNLYQPGVAAPIASLTWSMPVTVSTYAQAVDDLMNNYAGSPFASFVNLTDKGNYITAQILQVGQYMLEWTNNAFAPFYSGMIVPENFYPDTTPTTATYEPLKDDLIERIKYPPHCNPTGEFQNQNNEGGFYVEIEENRGWPLTDPAIYGNLFQNYIYGILPFTAPYYTDNGYVVPGTGATFTIPPPAYIENTTTGPLTFFITWDLNVAVVSYINPAIPPSVLPEVELNIAQVGAIATNTFNLFTWDTSYAGGQTYNIKGSGYITLPAGTQAVLWCRTVNLRFTINGTLTGFANIAGNSNLLRDTYPSFRAKYIYKDYQNSVYGAIGNTVVPSSIYDDVVELDFSDPRLESAELASDIKNVVLAVSLDSGVTWNDFATLDPYEFVGVGRQKYTYRGTEVLLTIPEATAILPYHNVPRLSKGQEFIDDRIWDSKLLTGYDAIPLELQIDVDYELLTTGEFYGLSTQHPPTSVSRWRRGWRGWIGIVYYDDADRRSPVCIDPVNSYVEIPSYNDEITILSTAQKGLNPAYLRTRIFSKPPSWAKKYQFVRSEDLSQQAYLLWCADELDYVNDDDTQVSASPTAQTKYIRIDISNIAYYTDKTNKGAQISFTFTDGDRIKFIQSTSSVVAQANDYVIAKVTTTFIYVVYDGSFQVTPADGYLIEFYTPRAQAEKLLYYEFGECYDIEPVVQNGIQVVRHKGGLQDQVYAPVPLNVFTPAITELKTGDVWYRARDLYYNTGAVAGVRTFLISSSTPSDYTDVNHNNNGRVNSTELLGELYQDTGLVFSDQYISGTQVNGLGAVQPANYKQFSTVYGGANKLLVVNNDILKIFFGNGYQLSIYVNQGVIRQAQGGGNIISVIDEVAANSHIIQRSLGTVNAESVVLNDEGDVFGYDGTEGVCWLGAGNGLVDISDTGMSIQWRNYGLSRLALQKGKSQTPAIFDLSNDQYIITLNALQPNPEILPVAHIKLPDITPDFLSQGGAQVDITIQPNNQVIYSAFTNATSWAAILQTAFSGWTLAVNADGSVDVTAPTVTGYVDSSIIITVTYNGSYTIPPTASTGTYTFNFEGGQVASDNLPFAPVTLAYNKSRRGWINYYSFTPEYYGRLRNQIIGFVDGKLHLHAKNTLYNNFYGVQYSSRMNYVLNNDYPKVKVPLALWYRGVGNWGAYLRNVPTGSYPWGQETQMTPAHFLLEEDGYYAPVLKNKLDPRYPNQDQAWVNGEDIRGDAPEIELYNDQDSQVRLDSSKTIYLYSENS